MAIGGKSLWVIAGCATLFLILAAATANGLTAGFDRTVLLGLRAPGDVSDPLGPAWFEEAARDVTALGGTPLLFLAAIGVALHLFAMKLPRLALFTLITVFGAQLVGEALKAGIDRPRPDLAPHEVTVYSASLPSGHAMMAAACFFTLAFVLGREAGAARHRNALLTAAAVLTFLVGASRVYLGVHWPTDVIAGWCVGVAWATAAAWIYRRL